MDHRPWFDHYEKNTPKTIEIPELTLPQILDNTAKKWPNQRATIFEGAIISYKQLASYVDRLAGFLVSKGLKTGDRVAIQMPNLPQTIIAYYGVLRAGGVAVMVNPMYVAREIEHQLNDAEVKFAIVMDAYWVNLIKPIRDKLMLEHIVVTALADFLPFPKNLLFPLVGKKTGLVVSVEREANVYQLKEIIENRALKPPAMPSDPDATANLQYSGGTTGVSKAAVLSHRNLVSNAYQVKSWFTGVEEGNEVELAALPFFHVFGLTVCMNFGILAGAAQVLVPNPRDIKGMVNLIKKYRPTIFPAVPAMFNAINNFPGIEKIDISSIKGCFSGSAPLPIEVLERFETLTGGIITEGFGMTESSPVTHANPLHGLRKPGSIGIPLPNTDAKIVDLEEGTKEMPIGEDGELILYGPQVMSGYWNREDETELTIRNGWLYSGDIAQMDEDGYFYIVGRKKDMIIAGGYNIYPREIDEILYEHPKVLEAAAIGVPHETRGETVKVFIVVQPGETLTAEEVIEFCRERLAPYKVPRLVEFRDELPKSTIGKVLRRVLRDEELAKSK